jgi:hypothetical protein
MPTLGSPPKQGANARTRLQLAAQRRNLARRLAKPAKLNGKLQKAAKRAFVAFDGQLDTGIVADWGYSTERARSLDSSKYRRLRRALASIGAVKIGRAKTQGRPWIWRLPE